MRLIYATSSYFKNENPEKCKVTKKYFFFKKKKKKNYKSFRFNRSAPSARSRTRRRQVMLCVRKEKNL